MSSLRHVLLCLAVAASIATKAPEPTLLKAKETQSSREDVDLKLKLKQKQAEASNLQQTDQQVTPEQTETSKEVLKKDSNEDSDKQDDSQESNAEESEEEEEEEEEPVRLPRRPKKRQVFPPNSPDYHHKEGETAYKHTFEDEGGVIEVSHVEAPQGPINDEAHPHAMIPLLAVLLSFIGIMFYALVFLFKVFRKRNKLGQGLKGDLEDLEGALSMA